ncbi:MAG: DUF3373 family protein, partial [Nitrospiraceae bacterium]|nr:DUF3373 family protein [Nitrospiraceae bacterium]
MKKFLLAVFAVLLLLPVKSYAEQQVAPWLTIGGDYQARLDYLQGSTPTYWSVTDAAKFAGSRGAVGAATAGQDYRNNSLLTNRFGLDIQAKALQNVSVKARLLMYKVWGSDSSNPVTSHMFFLDRAGVFDGDLGHVPSSDFVNVDYAYATWSNIADLPVWFSIGRRPSTNGVPGNLRRNAVNIGSAGVPSFLIDYAFDGLSIGYAPYIEALPGAYAKFCLGKGFDSGFINHDALNQLHDTTMVGIQVVPYNTDALEVQLQWNRAIDIFDAPPDYQLPTDATGGVEMTLNPTNNLGNIDQFGATGFGKIKNVNYFVSGALSITHPNGNQATNFEAIGVPAA